VLLDRGGPALDDTLKPLAQRRRQLRSWLQGEQVGGFPWGLQSKISDSNDGSHVSRARADSRQFLVGRKRTTRVWRDTAHCWEAANEIGPQTH
jgi:hypothetical protein